MSPERRHGGGFAITALCLSALIAIGTVATERAAGQSVVVDTTAIRADTYFLSHDLLKGRATGTPEADVAALYIASRCRDAGLRPVTDTFYQQVPLERLRIGAGTNLKFTVGPRNLSLTHPQIVLGHGTVDAFRNVAGSLLFAGTATHIGEGNLDSIDIRGAVILTVGLIAPPLANQLHQRGAVGVIQLLPDTEIFTRYSLQLGAERLTHADPSVRSTYLPRIPLVVAGPAAIQGLRGAGRSLRDAPAWLGVDVGLEIEAEREYVDAQNVVCMLPGSVEAAADTVIALAAHYDHLGVGPPDSLGDSIYNGFSDNAAGVAMLLALAKGFRSDTLRPLKRSLLFLFFSGEERGLLGSDHYVTHPMWPLDRTTAVLTLDAGAPPAAPVSWEIAGVDSTGLGGLALRVAAAQGWTVRPSRPRPISDFFPFIQRQVPAGLIIPGALYQDLSADSSATLRRHWDRYHQPADSWSPTFPLDGLIRYVDFAARIVREVDEVGLTTRRED